MYIERLFCSLEYLISSAMDGIVMIRMPVSTLEFLLSVIPDLDTILL